MTHATADVPRVSDLFIGGVRRFLALWITLPTKPFQLGITISEALERLAGPDPIESISEARADITRALADQQAAMDRLSTALEATRVEQQRLASETRQLRQMLDAHQATVLEMKEREIRLGQVSGESRPPDREDRGVLALRSGRGTVFTRPSDVLVDLDDADVSEFVSDWAKFVRRRQRVTEVERRDYVRLSEGYWASNIGRSHFRSRRSRYRELLFVMLLDLPGVSYLMRQLLIQSEHLRAVTNEPIERLSNELRRLLGR